MADQDLYSGLIRLHVLYHASRGTIFGFVEGKVRRVYAITARGWSELRQATL